MTEINPMLARKARNVGVESDLFDYTDRQNVDIEAVLETALGEVSA